MDVSVRGQWRRWLPFALVSTPAWLALVPALFGSAKCPIQPGAVRPSLAFHQYLVDLGETAPSEEIYGRFTFTNVGEQAVSIEAIEASCGCLKPQLRKRQFAPHETGDFVVRVQTASEAPGPKEYRIQVKYHDPLPREVAVVFRAILPDNQVTIRPRALMFYQFSDQPASQDIVIVDRRPQPLSIRELTCTSPFVKVTPGEVKVDEHGHRELRFRVTLSGAVPAGRHQTRVVVKTDDPTYRELRVPVFAEGRRDSPSELQRERKATQGARDAAARR